MMNQESARCYNCMKTLDRVFPDVPDESEQWENALVIDFEGGYGMFTDYLGPWKDDVTLGKLPGDLRIVICHECAHDLCEKVPWIYKLIDPYRSHSHRVDSVPKEHPGWDYPRK